MAQEVTLSLKESNVAFIEKHAEKIHTSVSEIIDNYLELLQKIDAASKKEKLNPLVEAISGIVSTGKNETVESVFE